MPPDLVLAIDLGSSWCKAAYLDRKGSVVAEGRVFSRTITELGNSMLEGFWRAVTDAVRLAGASMVDRPQPKAIGFSCRGLFGICLDQAERAFVPSCDILSAKRSPDVAAAFRAPVWGETGPYSYGYAVRLAGLISGLRKSEPREWQRIHRVGALHDYIVYQLCGHWVTDPSTGPSAMVWPQGLIELSGLPLQAFPTILESWVIAGGLTPGAAEALQLPAGIPVVAGLHDGAAANVGTGTIHPGDACLTLGTNFAVRVVTGDRLTSDCFGYIVAPGQWAWVDSVPRIAAQLDLVAATLSASSLDLRASHLRLGMSAAAVTSDAQLPSLPLGDDAALLAAVGDASRQGYSDGEIYRAMLHIAATGVRDLVERARRDGARITRFVATGGGVQNTQLLHVLASVLKVPVQVGPPEAGLLGAGMVGAIGAGWYSSLSETGNAMASSLSTVHPQSGDGLSYIGKVHA